MSTFRNFFFIYARNTHTFSTKSLIKLLQVMIESRQLRSDVKYVNEWHNNVLK